MKINLFKIMAEKSKNKSYKNDKINSKNFIDKLNKKNIKIDIDDYACMDSKQRERYIFALISGNICEGKEVKIRV